MPNYLVIELVEAVRSFTIDAIDEQHAADADGSNIIEAPLEAHDPIRNVSVTRIPPAVKP